MRNLEETLNSCFENAVWNIGYRYPAEVGTEETPLYMIIPIPEGSFEIPVFALKALSEADDKTLRNVDTVAALMKYDGVNSTYKSLDARMRDALNTYYNSKLIKIDTIENNSYYATQGAIFNKYYQPLMMLTWEIQKYIPENTSAITYRYRFIRPVLRIMPEVMRKSNAVERYIANRILSTVISMEQNIYVPTRGFMSCYFDTDYTRYSAKVIIDDNPFKMRQPDAPSVSITNRKLLDIAAEYIEETVR